MRRLIRRFLEPVPTSRSRRPARGERGQALVEFALVAPIQLLVILGVLQVVHILVGKQVLAYAAHAAARAALVGRDPDKAASMICSAVSPISRGGGLTVPGWGKLERSPAALTSTRVPVVQAPRRAAGSVRAVVEHDFHLIIPIVNIFFADRLRHGHFTLRLREESLVFKPWSDSPRGEGHPWMPDVPLGNSQRGAQ